MKKVRTRDIRNHKEAIKNKKGVACINLKYTIS